MQIVIKRNMEVQFKKPLIYLVENKFWNLEIQNQPISRG